MNDECLYYNLERYLLKTVRSRFLKQGWIGAFDFFSIVIWKANRAKSKVANKICRVSGEKNLEKICHKITKSLGEAKTDKERMYILISEWKFRLPMASAILTILYPKKFTVYDYRAAEQVGDTSKLNTKSNFEAIWTGYLKFKGLIVKTGKGKTLRDKDRYLFGKSRIKDLKHDIKSGFKK